MFVINLKNDDIKELQKRCRNNNVFPIFLTNTYFSKRPNPVYEKLKDLAEQCIRQIEQLNKTSIISIAESLPFGLKNMLKEYFDKADSKEFIAKLALYYITAEVQKKFLDFDEIIKYDKSKSKILKEYPELENFLNKDGLLSIESPDFILKDGGIFYKNHVFQYHQFLRNNFSSNFNFEFLTAFINLKNCFPENKFYIAIDHSRIMEKKDYRCIVQKDYWFGPKFSLNKLDDPNAEGTTIHGRIKPSFFDLNLKLDRTEFYWKTDRKNLVKTFEIEELSSIDNIYDSFNINRYVHSERKIKDSTFRHFDGAVKIYDNNKYSIRLDKNIPKNNRSPKKIKLFRIDGKINNESWLNLLIQFFKKNEMVIEYFDSNLFHQQFDKYFNDFRKSHTKC